MLDLPQKCRQGGGGYDKRLNPISKDVGSQFKNRLQGNDGGKTPRYKSLNPHVKWAGGLSAIVKDHACLKHRK